MKKRMYYAYRDVPFDITYPSAWRQRGYAVRQGEKPIAWLRHDFGGNREDLPLYGLSQTRRIKGEKAANRRGLYIAALYGEL